MQHASPASADWVDGLDVNDYGRRVLTLAKALAMANAGARGWYVAPFAMEWTIGRASAGGERFHILRDDGEPICFRQREDAARFIDKLLRFPAAAPIADGLLTGS